jgi:hypothetical protein
MATDGINLLTILLIAAFAVERVSAGILFLLQLFRLIGDPDLVEDTTQRAHAKRRYTLYHFIVSGILVVFVLLYMGDFRFLDALGLGNRADLSRVPLLVDRLLLAVVLVGGAEQMSAFLKMVGAPSGGMREPGAQPVEVSGKLIVEEPSAKK